jgi:O-ureido-D-serine cyclo-ligase
LTRVALVTAQSARHLDADLPPLVGALEAIGCEPEVTVWDDAGVEWGAFDLVVVRSTWDYAARRDELLAWAERVGATTDLANEPAVLRWSSDKHYLADLSLAGVPCVPTAFCPPDDPVAAVDSAFARGGDIVVKPAIGAGSIDAERFPADRRDAALAHIERLGAAGRTAMVQPYVAAVDDRGETALVLFEGQVSHAVRKGPILRRDGTVFVEGLYAEEEIGRCSPADDEVAVALAALDVVPPGGRATDLLYARVDLVRDLGGTPQVLELELVEPSVFLTFAEGSAERFAAAVARRAGGRSTAASRPR